MKHRKSTTIRRLEELVRNYKHQEEEVLKNLKCTLVLLDASDRELYLAKGCCGTYTGAIRNLIHASVRCVDPETDVPVHIRLQNERARKTT